MSKNNKRADIGRRGFTTVSAATFGGMVSLAQLGEARTKDQLEPIEPFSIQLRGGFLCRMRRSLSAVLYRLHNHCHLIKNPEGA